MFSKQKVVRKTHHIEPGTVVKVMRASRCGIYLFSGIDNLGRLTPPPKGLPNKHGREWLLHEELVVLLEQTQRSTQSSKTFKVLTARGEIGYVVTQEFIELDKGEWDAVWLEEPKSPQETLTSSQEAY